MASATGSFGANVSLRTVAVVGVVSDSPCAFVTVCDAGTVSTVALDVDVDVDVFASLFVGVAVFFDAAATAAAEKTGWLPQTTK